MSLVFVPPPPSPRARRLADALTRAIDEFRRGEPGLSSLEIRQALRLAATRGGAGPAGAVLVAVMAALVLLGLLAYFLTSRGG